MSALLATSKNQVGEAFSVLSILKSTVAFFSVVLTSSVIRQAVLGRSVSPLVCRKPPRWTGRPAILRQAEGLLLITKSAPRDHGKYPIAQHYGRKRDSTTE